MFSGTDINIMYHERRFLKLIREHYSQVFCMSQVSADVKGTVKDPWFSTDVQWKSQPTRGHDHRMIVCRMPDTHVHGIESQFVV